MPVVPASVTTGMPIEPNATGAVFASRQMPAAKNGEKPEARQHRGRDGDRRAEARRAFDERAERERDQHRLQAPVRREAADRVLDDLEVAGLERDAIQHDGPEDDPADRQQAERARP